MVLGSGVDSRTRLEILRLIAEMDNPVGADTLTGRLAERGIHITVDAVRYHLRVLDEQKLTARVSNRGRSLTSGAWKELQRSLVDTRMRYGLARHETLAQQVTFDMDSGCGQVAASLTLFPSDRLQTILSYAAKACRAGICVSDRVGVLSGGDRIGSSLIPHGKVGVITVSAATIDGVLLSHGVLFRPTFGGLVEVAAWHPYRFVDVVDYGHATRDPVEILIRPGSTRICSTAERGYGLVLSDLREVAAPAKDRARAILAGMREWGFGGVLMIGELGQPTLGVPVQSHNFGVALVAGINPVVAPCEAGVSGEFLLNEVMVDYSTLQPVESFLSESEIPIVGGRLLTAGWNDTGGK